MKAVWNDKVIAESDDIVTVEGNAYFPAAAVKAEYLTDSATTSVCGLEGLGELPLAQRGRQNQPGRRLVLQGAKISRR